MRVLLASAADLPPMDQDDDVLAAGLRARGVAVDVVPWDAPALSPEALGGVDAVVLRSTWDYVDRHEEFVAWAVAVGQRAVLLNPAEVVRWNTHKGYLIELEERGAPIVPTAWLGHRDRVDLDALLAHRGWDDAVVKPCVAAGASGLVRVRPGRQDAQQHLDTLLARGDVMVQPTIGSVHTTGELSVVVVDGRVSHAVRKRPAPGDLRSQIEFGGEYLAEEPGRDASRLAEWVVEATGHDLCFARVDLLADVDGSWLLGELEAVEPALLLQWAPGSAARLADAIIARVG